MSNKSNEKRAIHPSGTEILFQPDTHSYFVGETELISATSMIYAHFPLFDAQSIAAKKAKKDKTTAEALLVKWEEGRKEASALGNAVHLMAETILTKKDLNAADSLASSDRELKYLNALKHAIPKILRNYEVVELEKIVFSPQYLAAGTIDILLRNKKTGNLLVADWKTNKEIKFSSFRGERGHGPCSHLLNCNYIHYSLQLSLYKEILSQEGYYPGTKIGCAIIHLDQQNDVVLFKQIDPKDLGREARAILESRRSR